MKGFVDKYHAYGKKVKIYYTIRELTNWVTEIWAIRSLGDEIIGIGNGGGNPWRGMIYGMAVRYPWTTEGVTCNPIDIWKVWDEFGIASADMIGYWDERSIIKTSNEDLLLSYYQKEDKILISLASWAETTVNIRIKADWETLGYDPTKSKLIAPSIKNFQAETIFNLEEMIPVEAKRGWLLLLNK